MSFVSKYGSPVPYQDELCNLPFLQGRANTWDEYWLPHNEHRMPLPRWIYKTVYTATGGNVKACQYLNAGLLAVSSLLVLSFVIRIRGHASYTDALIPLLLVGPNHWESLIMGFLVQFTLGLTLNLLLLSLMVMHRSTVVAWPRLGAAFITTLLIGTCGSNSLVFMSVGVLWLAWIAVTHWNSARGKSLVAGVLSITALVGFLVLIRSLPVAGREAASPAAIVKMVLQLFSLALGNAGKGFGEITPGYPLSGIVLAAAFLAVCLWSLWQIRRSNVAAAIACYAVGMVALIAGIAYGRAGFVHAVYGWNRYATLVSPMVPLVFLTMMVALPKSYGRFWSTVLFLIVALVTWPNWVDGKSTALKHAEKMAAVERDLKAGMPIPFLSDRYWTVLYYPGPELLRGFLEEYSKLPASLFHTARPMPEVTSKPLSFRLITRDDTTCRDNEAVLAGVDGSFELILSESPRPFYALEMTYTLSHPSRGFVVSRISTWPQTPEHRDHPIENQLIHSEHVETTKIYLDRSLNRIRFDLHFAKGTKLTIHSLRELTLRAESAPRP